METEAGLMNTLLVVQLFAVASRIPLMNCADVYKILVSVSFVERRLLKITIRPVAVRILPLNDEFITHRK